MHDNPIFGRFAGVISRHAAVIVGLLMMVAGGLMASAPNLEELALTHGSPMMPTNTQSAAALKHMAKAFGESESNNTAAVVVVKDQPFTEEDRQFRAQLMKELRADTAHVEPGMDMWSDPQFATASESPDKKVALAQLQLAGEIGGPKAMESAKAVQHILDNIAKPPGTTVYATGTSQAAADQINTMMRDVVIIGGLSLVLVGGLLLLVYRSLVVAFLPLITVGVAVGIATPVTSFLTLAGLIPTSMMTNALMGALALGAGTDYSIFFIGRYQEGRRAGLSVDDAFRASYRGVAPVVIASGLTVAGALSCMSFAQLDMMKSMGLPGAITMIFTVLSAVTVTPGALLIGARRFGWFEPRSTIRSTRLWRRVGIRVARWPKPIFITTFSALILLMMVIPSASFNYDELQFIPKDMPSAAGMNAIQEHFPAGQMNPDMILIRAPEDLRTSANIGLLEKAAQQITKLDSVASVQWITRPTGMPMDQTSLMYSVRMAGTMMSQNKIVMEQRQQRMHTMTTDMNSMMSTLQGLQGTLRTAQQGAKQFSAAAQPIQSSLNQLKSQINSAMGPVREAVRAQPNCAADPMCVGAQSTLSNFENMSSVTDQMRSLVSTSGSMTGGLTQAARTMPRMVESMSSMQDLMTETNEQMTQMMSQIDTMTSLMQDLGRSSAGTGDYFYFPAQMLSDPRFKPYLKMMFSEDGTTTRMIVIGSGSSYGDEGIQRVRDLAHEMKYALKGTRLEGSVIEIAGPAALIGDMRVMLDRDEKLIMIGCLTVIFTVVLLLLRGLVASLIVIGSVLVSFASTLGLALVIWQHVLGIQLHWSVPVAVFAILISVGADYNLLVASRFKEEMSAGIRTGVVRAIAGTGGVVTTAGLVFAMTQFAMMGSSLVNIAQMGSTIGMGLIIDTFVVRTFTVPTLAVILDKKFWWPLPMNQLWRRS